MEITVRSEVSKKYKPDIIEISIDFVYLREDFNSALSIGVESFEEFIEKVLKSIGFDKNDLKTQKYDIIHKTEYDREKEKKVEIGYEYNQKTKLVMDNDMKKLGEFMNKTIKLKNPPQFYVSFCLKNIDEAKKELLELAFIKAKEKAEIIAKSSDKKLKKCLKVDYSNYEQVLERNMFKDLDIPSILKQLHLGESIARTFVPEDIEISESISCIWKAK